MRVYHDESGYDDEERWKFLCDLECNHSHVDLCYVGNIPKIGDIERKIVVHESPSYCFIFLIFPSL